MTAKPSIPERALAQILDPKTDAHVGWIVAQDHPIEIGFATRSGDTILIQNFDGGTIPEGAQLVVVLPVVR